MNEVTVNLRLENSTAHPQTIAESEGEAKHKLVERAMVAYR